MAELPKLPPGIDQRHLGFQPALLGQSSILDLAPLPDGMLPGVRLERNGNPNAPHLRYAELGPLGAGGMGTVIRVQDRVLGRIFAVKLIHPEWLQNPDAFLRFLDEAQITAQLDHPALVPVHDLGQLRDGRVWFSMREVQGETLTRVSRRLHLASTSTAWGQTEDGWTLRRMMAAFVTICEAMAFAHAHGVVHRDLKPGNIMIGAFGQTLVLDWGIARVMAAARAELRAVETVRRFDGVTPTQMGSLVGTPAYMPPEQARGEHDRVAPASDVYALGSVLYHLLSGSPPFRQKHWEDVAVALLAGPPPSPIPIAEAGAEESVRFNNGTASPPVPAALWSICQRAMAREPGDRYGEAGELALSVRTWLDGAQRLAEARAQVDRARSIEPELELLQLDIAQERLRAAAMLHGVQPWDPLDRKRDAWAIEDHADSLACEAALREAEITQLLHGALERSPDLVEARDQLAAHYRTLHMNAEVRRDPQQAARFEALLRAHDTGRNRRYLTGMGTLSLEADADGAVALVAPLRKRDRRLQADLSVAPIPLPIIHLDLPHGSYQVTVRAPGRAEVRLPVRIERNEDWLLQPPGASSPQPLHLPSAGELGADDVVVCGGWSWVGGDQLAIRPLRRRRIWVDDMVFRRFPVTHQQFLDFLRQLNLAGRSAEAERHVPRERGLRPGDPGQPLYRRDDGGQWTYDPRRDPWRLDQPVVLVDWHSAIAFARWEATTTGLPWRLPYELEWEAAARAGDGRAFPWGDFADPTWCNNREASPARPRPSPVDSFPIDESVAGVRGLAGNVAEWCMDAFQADGPEVVGDRWRAPSESNLPPPANLARTTRGGFWAGGTAVARSAYRYLFASDTAADTLGFRLVRPLRS
jgi:eukaryotic-like serine/threonine-protein kinase